MAAHAIHAAPYYGLLDSQDADYPHGNGANPRLEMLQNLPLHLQKPCLKSTRKIQILDEDSAMDFPCWKIRCTNILLHFHIPDGLFCWGIHRYHTCLTPTLSSY